MELVLNMNVVSKYHVDVTEQEKELQWIASAKLNPQKFAPLYDKYYEQIFRFIYQRLNEKDVAFDTTSQVFLKAIENIKKYEYRGVPFSSWLYRIARNEVYTLFKNKKAERTINIEAVHIHNIIDEMETGFSEHHYEKVIALVSELDDDELQLIEMRFFEKRSFKEIGEIIEITENNAKVRLYRTLNKLKGKIK